MLFWFRSVVVSFSFTGARAIRGAQCEEDIYRPLKMSVINI